MVLALHKPTPTARLAVPLSATIAPQAKVKDLDPGPLADGVYDPNVHWPPWVMRRLP